MESPFADLNINSNSRMERWQTEIEYLHKLLVDANINVFNGGKSIQLNYFFDNLLLPNIILGGENNFLGVSPAAEPETFKIVNVYPLGEYGLNVQDRIVRFEQLVDSIKEELINWINSGQAHSNLRTPKSVPNPLFGIIDDEIINLFELPLMRLFVAPSYKWQTWSPINPVNIEDMFSYICHGCCFYKTVVREKIIQPDMLYINTDNGPIDLIRHEIDKGEIISIKGLIFGEFVHLFDFSGIDSIFRLQNLNRLNYTLHAEIERKIDRDKRRTEKTRKFFSNFR